MKTNTKLTSATLLLAIFLTSVFALDTPLPKWKHLSSMNGDLPKPDVGRQVASLIVDIDQDGTNNFVIASYEKMAWFRRTAQGWTRYVIEPGANGVRMEAGGDVADLNDDGYLDIVMGPNQKTGEIWWWKKPGPKYAQDKPWNRYQVITVEALTTTKSSANSLAMENYNWLFGTIKVNGCIWRKSRPILRTLALHRDSTSAGEQTKSRRPGENRH